MVAIKTGAAPTWVFCMPVESGDPDSPPEVGPVGGQVVDPKSTSERHLGVGLLWRGRPEGPLAAARSAAVWECCRDRRRGGQESDQLVGDLPGDVAGQPVVDARNQHEAGVEDAGGRGAHVAGWDEPSWSPDSSNTGSR